MPVDQEMLKSLLGKGLLSADEGSGGYIRPAFWSPRALKLYSSRLCKPLRPEKREQRQNKNRRGLRAYVKDLIN